LANPSTVATLSESKPSKERTQQILIAVSPAEVVNLSAKLSMDAEFTVVPRSGDGDEDFQPETSDNRMEMPKIDPLANARMIETITGKNRQIVVFMPDSEGKDNKLTLETGPPSEAPPAEGQPRAHVP
jgi:hypothetical protein